MYACDAFPEQTYSSFEEAELETLIEYGVSYINGDLGYITEVSE